MATIEEAYNNAGVVHGGDCSVCYQAPPVKHDKYHKLKITLDVLLLISVVAAFWLLVYHLDWIVGGLPQ